MLQNHLHLNFNTTAVLVAPVQCSSHDSSYLYLANISELYLSLASSISSSSLVTTAECVECAAAAVARYGGPGPARQCAAPAPATSHWSSVHGEQ